MTPFEGFIWFSAFLSLLVAGLALVLWWRLR